MVHAATTHDQGAGTVSFTHTNSKGTVYTLHRREVRLSNGTTRTLHFFAPREGDTAIDALPDGYTVAEAKTGLPLLKRTS